MCDRLHCGINIDDISRFLDDKASIDVIFYNDR